VWPRESSSSGCDDDVQWRRCLKLASLGALISLGLVVVSIWSSPAPEVGETEGGYVTMYRPPADQFETLLNRADGQAYAALAQDPALQHPEAFDGGRRHAAYWMARPGLPYALFALSGGQPDALPGAFIIVEAVAGGLLVLGAAALLHRTGRRDLDRLALATLALPGAVLGVVWLGQDVLATGLALLGLVAWFGRGRAPLLGCALFVVAGLTRETMLILVFVVLVGELTHGGLGRSRTLLLVIPFATYLGWGVVVSARYGAQPSSYVRSNLGFPFTGVWHTIDGWSEVGVVIVAAQFALVIAAIVRPWNPFLRWLVVAYLVASSFTGDLVWVGWEAGVRVTLPLVAFALLTVVLPAPIAAFVRRERQPEQVSAPTAPASSNSPSRRGGGPPVS
jgi:hypothetical protein